MLDLPDEPTIKDIGRFFWVGAGYLDPSHGLLVTDGAMLRARYLTGWASKLEALSLAPTDLLYGVLWKSVLRCDGAPCAVVVRANRLLRLPRLLAFFDKTETRTSWPNAFRIAKVLVYLFVIIHWNACLYFALSNAIGFGSDGWVVPLVEAAPPHANLSLSHQYIYSFYW